MAVSPRRLAANKRNAQRSTGPRTTAGKAQSSRNALKHGLSAEQHIIPGEVAAEYDENRDRRFDELAPVGPVEEYLVRRAISSAWRVERAARIEADLLQDAVQRVAEATVRSDTQVLGQAVEHLDAHGLLTLKLSGHEVRLARQVERALTMLREAQERRQTTAADLDDAWPVEDPAAGGPDVEPGADDPADDASCVTVPVEEPNAVGPAGVATVAPVTMPVDAPAADERGTRAPGEALAPEDAAADGAGTVVDAGTELTPASDTAEAGVPADGEILQNEPTAAAVTVGEG